MRIISILALIFIASCATQIKSIKHEGRTLVVKNGIEIEKARVIVSQFLLQESRSTFKRKITIEAYEEKYRKMCHASTHMPESEKEFCAAQYTISYSADPYCVGGSSVIENCGSGKCTYKISEYTEICE
jgi:competence protein ComGC